MPLQRKFVLLLTKQQALHVYTFAMLV